MSYEQAIQAVLDDPEDDDARMELATVVEDNDRNLARYIRLEVEAAAKRRSQKRSYAIVTPGADLLLHNSARWRSQVSPYAGMGPYIGPIQFERGLVWQISMNPYLFLEEAAYVCRRIAPLRSIEFFPDPDGDPFPMAKLAASPLLARFDRISFRRCDIDDDDLAIFAASPHLGRLYELDLSENDGGPKRLTEECVRIVASHEGTRKCLTVTFPMLGTGPDWPPREIFEPHDDDDNGRGRPLDHWDLSDYGLELERQHGYLPWLHLENVCHSADLGYWTQRKVLPCFAPGSPADAPAPFGSGLRAPAGRGRPRSGRRFR